MDRVEIEKLLKAAPFEPFTIHTTDGDLIGVKSAEFALLAPRATQIAVWIDVGDGGATRVISLRHISQLTIGPSADSNAA